MRACGGKCGGAPVSCLCWLCPARMCFEPLGCEESAAQQRDRLPSHEHVSGHVMGGSDSELVFKKIQKFPGLKENVEILENSIRLGWVKIALL
jgi:hypothetical protein